MSNPYASQDQAYDRNQDFNYYLETELEKYVLNDGTYVCPECKTAITQYDENDRHSNEPGFDPTTAVWSCEDGCIVEENLDSIESEIADILEHKMSNRY